MDDLFFKDNDQVFSCRSAGILIVDEMILMQETQNRERLIFPGGHIKYHEKSEDALRREFKEELSQTIIIEKFLSWEEYFFKWEKMHIHQISAFYEIKGAFGLNLDCFSRKKVDNVVNYSFDYSLKWIPKKSIINSTIYPNVVLESIDKKLHGKLLG